MPVTCDVIVGWDTTPEQLTALGTALWSWCVRGAGAGGMYQYLDNQALADLIAGRFPASGRTPEPVDRRGAHVRIWDRRSDGRSAAIEILRREIATVGVVDILVDGTSWSATEPARRDHAPAIG